MLLRKHFHVLPYFSVYYSQLSVTPKIVHYFSTLDEKVNDGNEIIYEVDEKDNVIGPKLRSDIRKFSLFHRVTYIFLENYKGMLWI